ncbi:MAG: hypothetical protein PUB35_02030 [Campylobacteraceae bacterium]|nr:hypothetical protein [Campylobacteraceae bacterium]
MAYFAFGNVNVRAKIALNAHRALFCVLILPRTTKSPHKIAPKTITHKSGVESHFSPTL